jgi:hypothetical protein
VLHNSECVFLALGTQHAMRMCYIFMCGTAVTTTVFPHYVINGTFPKKYFFEWEIKFDFLYNFLSETFLTIRRTETDMIVPVYWSPSIKYSLYLSDFNET